MKNKTDTEYYLNDGR